MFVLFYCFHCFHCFHCFLCFVWCYNISLFLLVGVGLFQAHKHILVRVAAKVYCFCCLWLPLFIVFAIHCLLLFFIVSFIVFYCFYCFHCFLHCFLLFSHCFSLKLIPIQQCEIWVVVKRFLHCFFIVSILGILIEVHCFSQSFHCFLIVFIVFLLFFIVSLFHCFSLLVLLTLSKP